MDAERGIIKQDFCLPEKTDAVIYLSQSPYYRQPAEMAWHLLEVNLVSAVTIAEISRKAGVKRMLYASTGSVYAPSFKPLPETAPLRRDAWYPASKVFAEEALRLFSEYMELTMIRLFGVYGPGQKDKLVPNLIKSMQSDFPITIESNSEDPTDQDGMRISLTYIDDTVKCLEKLLSIKTPPVLNLASPEPVSIRQAVNVIAACKGMNYPVTLLPTYRQGNLIADTSLLSTLLQHDFLPFEAGIKNILTSDTL